MMYVALSRAKAVAAVYTDDRGKLVSAIRERAGEKQIASESPLVASASRGASLG